MQSSTVSRAIPSENRPNILDHFLDFDAIYAETILAKQSFEKFAAKPGVRIQHYHCDNRQFADNNFKRSFKASHQ
jgi:hypothetical protein